MSRHGDKAQNVIEYGLLIASIVLVVLLGVARFGALIAPWFAALAGGITTAGTGASQTCVTSSIGIFPAASAESIEEPQLRPKRVERAGPSGQVPTERCLDRCEEGACAARTLLSWLSMLPLAGQPATGDPLQARMLEIRDALLVQAAVRLLASPSACEMLQINNSADAVKIIVDAWKRIQTPD